MRKLSPDAEKIIADVYLVGSVDADPPLVLKDIARSVSIVGRMLDAMADRYSVPGKGLARMVTIAGSVLWGIVEIAVPGSLWSKLTRNWGGVLALTAVLMLLLGPLTKTTGMATVGVGLLLAVFVLKLLVAWLRRYMNTGDPCWTCMKKGIAIVAGLTVLALLLAGLVVLNSHVIAGKLMLLSQKVANLPRHFQTLYKLLRFER